MTGKDSGTVTYPRIALMVLFFLLCLAAVLGHELHASYRQAFAIVTRDAENLTGAIERHIVASSDKVDIILQETVRDYAKMLDRPSMADTLAANRDLLRREAFIRETQPFSLRIVGADGRIVFSAGKTAALPVVNVGDRNYFLKQLTNPHAGLIVSEPILSRFTGRLVFTLSRRITRADGSFAGVVQTAFRADYFTDSFSSINVGRNGAVALLSTELQVIASHPPLVGQTAKHGDLRQIAEMLDQGKESGSFVSSARDDSPARLYTFRRIGLLPLFVTVWIAEDDFLKGWREKARLYAASLATLCFALAALILLTARHAKRIGQLNLLLAEHARRADEANRAKSAFLASTGEKIRAPLEAIRRTTELLRSEDPSAARSRRIRFLESTTQYLCAVTSNILDLSQIESSSLEPLEAPFDMSDVVADISTFLTEQSADKTIRFFFDTEPIPSTLVGDRRRLQQLLLTHASRCLRAISHGAIVFRLFKSVETDEFVVLRFEFHDNDSTTPLPERARTPAVAMPAPANIDAHRAEPDDSGLDAMIVDHLASLLGGEAGIDSAGGGSTYWLCARFAKQRQPPHAH